MSRTLRYLTVLLLLFACSGKEKPLTPDTSDGNGQQEKPLLSDDKFGADINPTGNPIGGGEGYNRLLDPSEYLVTNRMELFDALQFAGTNQIVYIVDTARIDLTGHQNIAIRGGVTLASGRGKPGSQGALLYSNQLETLPLFVATGPNIR
ncbi:MAG: hypothetical protein J4F29_16665, partial [Candidatus Latescibacteria bacterium]|nr:hypothetical protein [Candidatus Latescibacterota bacterium]